MKIISINREQCMNKLNKKTELTEKTIHLMVTSLCERDCRFCCNKQYSISDIPFVTDGELKNAEVLCLTGGEPFTFTNPCEIARYYKENYPNIKRIYVYTNASELADWIIKYNRMHSNIGSQIDGLNISLKTPRDVKAFQSLIENNSDICSLQNNRLYVFNNLYSENPKGFEVINREWQKDFKPAADSIFRRL